MAEKSGTAWQKWLKWFHCATSLQHQTTASACGTNTRTAVKHRPGKRM